MSHSVILPLPPSANNIFANRLKVLRTEGAIRTGGRFKTPAYKAWITEAGFMLKTEPKWKIAGPVAISITLPHKLRGDIDNRVKPILDLLVQHHRIDDDRNVVELRVSKTWIASSDTCRVEIQERLP